MHLADFLVLAKKNTYAKEGEGGEEKLPDGGHRFVFEQGEFKYQDTYYGFNPFSGQELVWQNGVIIWSMNYWGTLSGDKLTPPQSANAVYAFLKRALSNVSIAQPYRGPTVYREDKWAYERASHDDDIKEAHGEEFIYFDQELAYYLIYHGGSVQEK